MPGGLKTDVIVYISHYFTEVMAELRSIENLPEDAKREILTRVAKAPGGARGIARLITLSKSFHQYSEDRDVLRAVSFSEMLVRHWPGFRYPDLLRLLEQFLEVLGLLAKSATAGNTDAQFLLATVVMICASTMQNANAELDFPLAYSLDLARTSNFITNLSDRRGYFELVKLFLSRAEGEEVSQMELYLQNFVLYFLEPGKETDYRQFQTSLAKFCELQSLADPSCTIAWIVEQFNHLCIRADSTMREMECSEEQRRPLLQSLVEMNDTVEKEMVLERLDTVEPVIKGAFEMAASI